MKIFSKIMLASLLTVGCMPTTQVRADLKDMVGIGWYVLSGLTGAYALSCSYKYNDLSNANHELVKIENTIARMNQQQVVDQKK